MSVCSKGALRGEHVLRTCFVSAAVYFLRACSRFFCAFLKALTFALSSFFSASTVFHRRVKRRNSSTYWRSTDTISCSASPMLATKSSMTWSSFFAVHVSSDFVAYTEIEGGQVRVDFEYTLRAFGLFCKQQGWVGFPPFPLY